MVLFDHLGHGQCAVRMGQPMQVDAESNRVQPLDQGLGIEAVVIQHAHGQIDDAHP